MPGDLARGQVAPKLLHQDKSIGRECLQLPQRNSLQPFWHLVGIARHERGEESLVVPVPIVQRRPQHTDACQRAVSPACPVPPLPLPPSGPLSSIFVMLLAGFLLGLPCGCDTVFSCDDSQGADNQGIDNEKRGGGSSLERYIWGGESGKDDESLERFGLPGAVSLACVGLLFFDTNRDPACAAF